MSRPTIAVSAALLASFAVLYLPTELVETQAALTASSAGVDGDTLTITLSAAVDASSTADESDFTVAAGDAELSVDSADVDGTAITLSLAEPVGDPDCDSTAITVSYVNSGSSIATSDDVQLSNFSATSVTNQTDLAPALVSVETDESGRYLRITFCEAIRDISFQWSDFSAFSVNVDGREADLNDLERPSASPARLDLLLSEPVFEGQAVTIAYDQSNANEDYPIQDADQGAKLVESWTAREATNRVDSPPKLESATALWDVITLTYSEALDADSVPDKTAFEISDKPYELTINKVAVSGSTVSLTVSGVIRGELEPEFQLSYAAPGDSPLQQADGAKQAADFYSKVIVSSTPTTKPAVEGAVVNGNTLTITFDMPLKNVAPASALTIGGAAGVSVSATSFSGSVVTLTLSAAVSPSDRVTVTYTKPNTSPRIEARNIRDADSFSNRAVTNNTPSNSPTFVSAAINAAGDTLTITMSKALLATPAGVPEASAFTLAGGSAAVSGVSVKGATVALTLSPKADLGETITIAYTQPTGATDGKLQSLSGGHLVDSWSAQSVTNGADGVPRPTGATVNGSSLAISFDRVLDTTSTPATTAFVLSGTDVTVSSVSVSGSAVTLTLSAAVAHDAEITVSYGKPQSGGIKRSGRTLFTESFSSLAVTNATPDPTPTFDSAAINAAGDTLTITMSKALLAISEGVPEASAFTLAGGSAAVSGVSIMGATVVLTLSPKADIGETITVAYTQPTGVTDGKLQSLSGGHLVDTWTAQSVTNGADGVPRPTGATVNGSSLAISFDRALDTTSTPETSAFSLTGATATVSSVSIAGSTVTLALSAAVAHDETITVGYTKPATNGIKRSGLPLFTESFSSLEVSNVTVDPAPMFDSAAINAAGDTLSITMSKALLATSAGVPEASAFTLAGGSAAVSGVSVKGSTIALTLSPKADVGEAITVAYTQPTGAADGKLQSLSGSHLVDSWTAQSVTNGADGVPRPTGARVNGSSLAINFDRALDTTSTPETSAFSLTGATATVSSVSITGSTVTLTLIAPVAHDAEITVGYAKPQSNGIKRSGLPLFTESFSSLEVENGTPDPTSTFVSGAINAAGDTLTITMSKALLETSAGVPVASAFTLAGGSAAVSGVSIDGTTVALTLSPKADLGETITVAYTQRTGPADGKLQSSSGGHLVDAWTAQSVTNGADGVPRPTAATINGSSLAISFDRALDAMSTPATSAFELSGTDATVSSVSIAGSTVTLTLSAAVAHDAELTVGYSKPQSNGIKRSGQTLFTESFSSLEVSNTTPDPTPTFDSASINAAGGTLTITMSKALLPISAGVPAASAFTISGGNAAVSGVLVKGTRVALTLSPKADVGETITVAYTQPTGASDGKLQSSSGGHLVESWSAQSVTNGADGIPRPTGATVNGSSLAISFDRALDTTSTPAVSALTLSGTDATVSSVSVSGSIVTLTFSAAVGHDDEITVGYTKPQTGGIKRSGQNLFAESFASLEATNATPVPLIRSVVGDEREIVITFSRELDTASTPGAAAFSLGADGPSIDSVTVSAMSVSLGLGAALAEGGEYTLAYTAPGQSPLSTSGAAAVPSFSEAVTNRTDVAPQVESATANAATVSLVFDQALDGDSALTAAAFRVGAEPTASVSAVSYDGDDGLTLTLTRSLVEDETATLSYVRPGSGGIADPGGKRTASFSLSLDNRTDTAPAPASGTVTDDEIVIVLDQDIFDDPRFQEEDGYPTDHFTVSGVDSSIGIDSVQVSNDGPDGVGKIVIALSNAVDELDTVLVRYFPSTGTIRIREDEDGRRRAEINNYRLKNLTRTAPSPESATLDGTALSLVFDRALDENASVEAAWFTVESGELTVEPGEYKVETASVSGSTVSLGVTPSATEDADYELTYTAPDTGGLASASGVRALGFSKAVGNETDYAPAPKTAIAKATGPAKGADQVLLSFDQRLDPSGSIVTSWFKFTPTLEIKAVTVDSSRSEGDQLLIELSEKQWVREGVSVKLSYTPPASGGLRDDDGDPEEQGDGNRVATFSIDIDNRVDVGPQVEQVTVNGDVLTIEFDQKLKPEHVPPPNCRALEARVADFDCDLAGDPTWFTVERTPAGANSPKMASIAEVSVAENKVTLRLKFDERARRGDAVKLSYQVQSVDDGKWNLRDTTRPENIVDSFGAIDVTNLTPAAATEAMVGRSESGSVIDIEFDGELDGTATLDPTAFTVTAGGSNVGAQSVRVMGTKLIISLATDVPECVAVKVVYTPGKPPLLDAEDRPIKAFDFPVQNLIDPDRGLQCVHSDFGGLVLTFVDRRLLNLQDLEWNLSVNGVEQELTVSTEDGIVELHPQTSICAGDSVVVPSPDATEEEALVPRRTISRAAPCAVSAVADGEVLSVNFDSPLDGEPPDVADFGITGGATIARIAGVSGKVLTLQLEPPGIDAGAQAILKYSGSSLLGGGLTVGRLTVPISDQTDPPRFTSGFGLGDLVILNFDQPLQRRAVAASRFSLVGPGLEIEIASVTISGASVQLQLTRSLPDDPDLIGVVYILRGRHGLAGLSGVLVPSGGFVVQNYTETAPRVISASVNAREAVLVFDQQVDAADTPAADFAVLAGHREIGVSALEWTDRTITLTLSEAVTSLDAARLRYSPGSEGLVRDRSGLPLAAFDIPAENLTPSPRTDAQIVKQARLRAGGGPTSFERELSRAFASANGARFGAAPGDGVATVVVGSLRLSVPLPQQPSDVVGISVSRLSNAPRLLRLLEGVPPACAGNSAGRPVSGWLLELQNPRGAPRVRGVEVSLGGLEAARLLGGCVLDLIAGTWKPMPMDGRVTAPSLIVTGTTSAFTRWVRRTHGA